jgi:thiosulfate/3-mercaptopyruvate sulfurtransferase
LLKDPFTLGARYGGASIPPDREAITYCGAGVWSAQAYFVLRLLDYPRVRLYDGSWQDWGRNAVHAVAPSSRRPNVGAGETAGGRNQWLHWTLK